MCLKFCRYKEYIVSLFNDTLYDVHGMDGGK
jgi:hypothetical protein